MSDGSDTLDELALLLGIEPTFTDAFESQTRVSARTKRALIAAMGYDAATDESARAAVQTIAERSWLRILEPVTFAEEGTAPVVVCTLHSAAHDLELPWKITFEDGSTVSGWQRWGDSTPLGQRVVEGRGYERRAIALPRAPLGYHTCAFQVDAHTVTTTLIVAPGEAYVPRAIEETPAWGVSLQLYALRRNGDFGVGDFTALAALAQLVAERGGAALALNPLHRLHFHNPAAASPYGPTSRFALDPLYIDPLAVPDFEISAEARALAASIGIAWERNELAKARLIDYERVSALKHRLIEALYAAFRREHLQEDGRPKSARGEAFAAFRREGGVALERLVTYECLAEFHHAGDATVYGWIQWPAEHRDPAGPGVQRFAQEHRERITFFAYLAWIADEQLAACARACAPMAVGLYRDLAVGAAANSAEAWSAQHVMRTEISVGAPPDPLNHDGQSWGLPALDPHALREAAYAPFAELLRANMRYAGALRIDHVMALMRLFWVPAGRPASEGAYVRYDLDEMLAVLALESRRARCMIVGEDLGTVPAGFRERLARARLFSTRLLYFEREPGGEFIAAAAYPRDAVASVGTHDVPPLAGWWSEHDIDVRRAIGLVSAEQEPSERFARGLARRALVERFAQSGVLKTAVLEYLRKAAATGAIPPDGALHEVAAAFLAAAPARLVLVALDDVMGELAQVNVPGTVDQHPNWRLRNGMTVEALRRDSVFARLAAHLSKAREEVRL